MPLRFVHNSVVGGGRRSSNTELALIPLIDFLIVVILFLLMSFSASGEIPVDKNTKLPYAENTLDMTDALLVAVTGTNILVDGAPAGSTRPIEDSNRLQKIEDRRHAPGFAQVERADRPVERRDALRAQPRVGRLPRF